MTTLQEKFESLVDLHSTIKKKFADLLVCELIDPKYLQLDIGLTACKREFLEFFLPVYLDMRNQKFASIERTKTLFDEFRNKSTEFDRFLTKVFETVFDKLDNLKISYENELDIEPAQRYLLIQDRIPFNFPANREFLKRESYDKHSDVEFEKLKQEFESLLRERENKKLLSVGINYSYANIALPKTYDIIFDSRDLTKYWEQKTIVRYAFNYRTYFHTDLWRGHHSHCLIEIIGKIPDIFNELPENNGGMNLHKGIGLCTKYDWQFIHPRTEI